MSVSIMSSLQWLELLTLIATAVALFWVTLRGNLGSDTVKLLKENKAAQDAAIKRLEDDAKVKSDQIANLNGQIQTLKEIPLGQIAKSLEAVTQLSVGFQAFQHFLSEHDAQAKLLADAAADKVIEYLKGVK